MRLPIFAERVSSSAHGLGVALLLFLAAFSPGRAQIQATAMLTNGTPTNGVYPYTITLSNTGTTNIGTLWFAWIPGQDYLATSPTNIGLPTGWSDIITHAGAGDGYAIQWKSSTNALAPGGQLNFTFESMDTPAEIAGNSTFFPGTPVGTSFIYSGLPFSGSSLELVVQPGSTPPVPLLFSDWQTAHGIGGSGATDSPFNDGVPNLLKYVYDIDPSRPMTPTDRAALPSLGTATINGIDYVTLNYRVSAQATQVTITAQESANMQTWSNAPAPVLLGHDTHGDLLMQARIPVSDGAPFVRLQVVLP